jgi:hypothetical protein
MFSTFLVGILVLVALETWGNIQIVLEELLATLTACFWEMTTFTNIHLPLCVRLVFTFN